MNATHTPLTIAASYRTYKAFLDHLATLRYVAIYPVQWGDDDSVYRTQLKGTQAQGYTCVHCDQLDDGEGMVPIGHVLDTESCSQLFAHISCAKGDTSVDITWD